MENSNCARTEALILLTLILIDIVCAVMLVNRIGLIRSILVLSSSCLISTVLASLFFSAVSEKETSN